MSKEKGTRRRFLKQAGATTAALSSSMMAGRGGGRTLQALTEEAPSVSPADVVAALGDVLIPTEEPEFPGYRRLEKHGITQEVLQGLGGMSASDFAVFNVASRDITGRTFLQSDAKGRAAFIDFVVGTFPPDTIGVTDYSALTHADSRDQNAEELIDSQGSPKGQKNLDKEVVATLQKVFRLSRTRILTIFYRNFPFHEIQRDKTGAPIPTDKEHQIINPNRDELLTGWDIAGFPGPLSFKEEWQRRKRFMEIHWHQDGEKNKLT